MKRIFLISACLLLTGGWLLGGLGYPGAGDLFRWQHPHGRGNDRGRGRKTDR